MRVLECAMDESASVVDPETGAFEFLTKRTRRTRQDRMRARAMPFGWPDFVACFSGRVGRDQPWARET